MEDCIEASWLQQELKAIQPVHLLVILDCCYSGGFPILPPLPNDAVDHHYTLWASSMPDQVSVASREGSHFSKYLVSGLHSGGECLLKARGIQTCNTCQYFREDCAKLDFLTVQKMQNFVFEHVRRESIITHNIEQRPYTTTVSLRNPEVPLAYAYDKPLAFTVWFSRNGEIEQPLMLDDPNRDIAHNRYLLLQQIRGTTKLIIKLCIIISYFILFVIIIPLLL